MRAVDTNVLVRLATRDDAGQVAVAEAFIAQGAWVSHVVLVEFAWVLESVYGFERRKIAAAVALLLDQRDLVVQDADVVTNAITLLKKGIGTDFADCMILEIARKAGHLPVGTFDRALGKARGAQSL
jgi:predicted nucleic-acid-binding protein